MQIYTNKIMNPAAADHLTRGLTVTELVEKTCWWNGPEIQIC